MLEDRLKLAITCRRLRSGPADAYIATLQTGCRNAAIRCALIAMLMDSG